MKRERGQAAVSVGWRMRSFGLSGELESESQNGNAGLIINRSVGTRVPRGKAIMVSPGSYIVYRDSPTAGAYHAVRVADDVEVATDPASARPVLQQVLDQYFLQDPSSGYGAGDIYVRAGIYELGTGFAGLNVRSFVRLNLDPTAILQVPSGYAGAVFVLASNNSAEVAQAQVRGGIIRESQPAQHQWTAFLLQAAADQQPVGILFNKICDTIVYGPRVGLALHVTGDHGFINANTFEFLRVWGAGVAIDFSITSGYQLGEEDFGILYNHFFDLQFQSEAARYQAGIQNVTGVHNTFSEVNVWDIPRAPAMTIGSTADRTLVIGGTLAGEYAANPNVIADQGRATKIV